MFKPISAAISIHLGFAPLYALAMPSSAVSTEAGVVCRLAGEVVDSVEKSESLFGTKATAISELWRIAGEHGNADWDSCGAKAVQPAAIHNVIAFIRALPNAVPLPEFAPEPDGTISMDWIRTRNCLFSVSVGSGKRLAYAWLDGSDKGHGVAAFERSIVPMRMLDGIMAVMADEPVTLRAT